MLEDEGYRTSSQYRYWSYTRKNLASLRQETNDLASERVRAAITKSLSAQKASKGVENIVRTNGEDGTGQNTIQTLTVPEELKIVRWGCGKIIEISKRMQPPVPAEVTATAMQYLRRFYLSNSPMTYNPRQIMLCALFLATKSEHWHITLHNFVKPLGTHEDEVKAPEFLLLQGLRFTLDVRHPMRGLEGGVAEILAMVQDGSLVFKEQDKGVLQKRLGKAAEHANTLLQTAAQMTDAYFLYTPSQIWLAALQIADDDLVRVYINKKLQYVGAEGLAMQERLLKVVSSCSELLASYVSPDDDPAEEKDIKRIGNKLRRCQNPDKADLVAVTRARAAEKREGAEGSDGEKALKKRKTEREQLQKDGDVFGGELKSMPP